MDAPFDQYCILFQSYDEVVARCDVIEDELKQVKIKLRQSERKVEELKLKYGEDGERSEDDEEKVKKISPLEIMSYWPSVSLVWVSSCANFIYTGKLYRF